MDLIIPILIGSLITLVPTLLVTWINNNSQAKRDKENHISQLERDKLKYSNERKRELDESKREFRKKKRDQIEETFQEWIKLSSLIIKGDQTSVDPIQQSLSFAKFATILPSQIVPQLDKYMRLSLKGEQDTELGKNLYNETINAMRAFLDDLDKDIFKN